MNFLNILKLDFKSILTNITAMFVIVVGAFIYIILYPSPYRNDIVKKQDIAVIDYDLSSLSREFAFKLNASRGINIKYYLSSLKEAKSFIKEGKIYGYIVFPKDMQKNLLLDRGIDLVYAANSNYFLIYSSIIESIVDVNNDISAHIKLKRALLKGDTPFLAALLPEPIPMYNPSEGFINYALAAIFVIILHQTSIGGVAIAIATINRQEEDEKGLSEYKSGANPWLLALCKYIVFYIIYFPIYLLYFGVGFYYYNVLVSSNLLDFALLALAFHFACVSYGLAIGSFIKDESKATQLVIFSAMPVVFSAGFIWPLSLIPPYILTIAKIAPAFWGVNAFLRLNQMGASFEVIFSYIIALLFMGILALFIFIAKEYKKAELK